MFVSEVARIEKLQQLYRVHVSDPGFFPEIIQRLHEMKNPTTRQSDENSTTTWLFTFLYCSCLSTRFLRNTYFGHFPPTPVLFLSNFLFHSSYLCAKFRHIETSVTDVSYFALSLWWFSDYSHNRILSFFLHVLVTLSLYALIVHITLLIIILK